jgi:transcriptional regulator with XRE-family HTH domain
MSTCFSNKSSIKSVYGKSYILDMARLGFCIRFSPEEKLTLIVNPCIQILIKREGTFMEQIDEKLIPKRIRQLRLERNMTQKALADAIEVTKGYISRMENAESAPPVGTLIALSQALGVELNAFFEVEDPEAYHCVTRKNERPRVARDHMAGATYEHLALNFPKRAFESYIIKVPGPSEHTQVNQHKGQEMLFVLKGAIKFQINGNEYVLQQGDAIYFNASYPHNGACISEEGAEIIGIIFNEQADASEQ